MSHQNDWTIDHVNSCRGVDEEAFGDATCGKPAHVSQETPRIPKLAATVRLVGKMNGFGFQEQQWLVEAHGRCIQMTELLYRVAEQANGEQSLDEIADKVSDHTEWELKATDVAQLIDSKLAPLGLLEGSSREQEPAPSPLDVNVKFKTLPPRAIEPISNVLRFFYLPFIALPVLVIATLAHWWLYHSHGITRGFHDTVYTPGGVLLVIGLALLAAVFHEFGHASALRYHGGRVGNMGVALYIVYPAFYTDVTDNYRLSRWARISTDLGGIYFHLVFAVALFGAYFIFHRELLLFCVLLIDLEIVEQFIPLIRLDGYWFLADLTGIPDFFSQMVPFLRTFVTTRMPASLYRRLPLATRERSKFPEVKPWIKAVFLAYILVAIPLLAYLFVRMLTTFPELVTTTWSGLLAQTAILKSVIAQREFITIVLVLMQIFFLTLPVPATLYVLWSVARAPLRRFLVWTSRAPKMQFAGITALASCAAALAVFAFGPSVRLFNARATAVPQAERLLREAQQATSRLNSISADVEGSIGQDHYTGKMILQRPNFARVEINGTKGLGNILLLSDGKIATTYFPDTNQFVQIPPGDHGEFVQSTVIAEVEEFFQPDSISAGKRFEYLGLRTGKGGEYDVIAVNGGSDSDQKIEYFISRTDKLLVRIDSKSATGGPPAAWAELKNIHENIQMDQSLFSWTLPRAAEPLQLPAGVQLPVK